MPRVLRREIDELTARTALRRVNLRSVERLLDNLPLFELQGNQELARTLLCDAIRADEKRLQHSAVGFVVDVLEELMVAREQLPVADAHPRDARIRAVASVSHDVAVAALDLHHDGRLFQSLEMLQNVSQLGGTLEIQ